MAVTLVTRCFVSSVGVAGVHIIVDEFPHPRPVVVSSYEFKGFLLAEMSRGYRIVMGSKYLELNIVGLWNIN